MKSPIIDPTRATISKKDRAMTPRLIALLCATTALSACNSDASNVPKQWGSAVSKFDLYPIFPPQEDVQPGDVLLIGVDTAIQSGEARNTWKLRIGQVDPDQLWSALQSDYSKRLVYAPPPKPPAKPTPKPGPNTTTTSEVTTTTTKESATADNKPTAKDSTVETRKVTTKTEPPPAPPAAVPSAPPAADPKAPPEELAASPGKPENPIRMRTLALPEMKLASYIAADFAGGGAIGTAVLNAFIGGASQKSVDISVSSLTEMHVDASTMLRTLRANTARFLADKLPPTFLIDLIAQRNRGLAGELCRANFAPLDDADITMLVVNEVLYTRTISFTYNDSTTFAAKLAASFPTPTGLATGTPGTAAPALPAGGTATDTATAQTNLQQMAAAYTAANPGAQAHLSVGTNGNLTLNITTPRPLAFGVAASMEYRVADLINTYRTYYSTPEQMTDGSANPSAVAALRDDTDRAELMCRFYGQDGSKLAAYLKGTTPTVAPTKGRITARTLTYR